RAEERAFDELSPGRTDEDRPLSSCADLGMASPVSFAAWRVRRPRRGRDRGCVWGDRSAHDDAAAIAALPPGVAVPHGAGGPPGRHPIALLSGADAVDPRRALHHLVDEVGVPAVIGFRSSDEAIEAATSSLIPNGILTVAALNTSPMLSSLPQPSGQPRLVWRT